VTPRDPSPPPAAVAFRRSLLDRAKNAERRDPALDVQSRLRLFCYDRLLVRVFSHPAAAGSWVLKGATSLLTRLPLARSSYDVDLATRQTIDEARVFLRDAAGADLGDHLQYRIEDLGELSGRTRGLRTRAVATCAGRLLSSFHVDVAITTELPAELDRARPLRAIDVPGLASLDYPAWPLPNAVADKVAATYEVHARQPSTRYRDLVDLYLIARGAELEASRLEEAMQREFDRRRLAWPEEFAVPDVDDWKRGWRRVVGEVEPIADVAFDDAMHVAKALLDPTFAGSAAGLWDPTALNWVALDDPGHRH